MTEYEVQITFLPHEMTQPRQRKETVIAATPEEAHTKVWKGIKKDYWIAVEIRNTVVNKGKRPFCTTSS